MRCAPKVRAKSHCQATATIGASRQTRLSQTIGEYPTRVVGTELKNPDFAAYAKAFGGFGVMVEKTADFAAAFRAAEKSGKPAIIHLKVDTNASTPATTLEAIRAKSLASAKP